MNDSRDRAVQQLRGMKIIAAALLMGLVSFLVLVLFLAQDRAASGSYIVSLLAVGGLVINGALSLVLPGILAQSSLRSIAAGPWKPPQGDTPAAPSVYTKDEAKLLEVKQTTLIIALALLEGVGFFGCLAYLIEGQLFALGVVGVVILFMLFNFPTSGGIRAWLDWQLAQLAELRQSGENSARD